MDINTLNTLYVCQRTRTKPNQKHPVAILCAFYLKLKILDLDTEGLEELQDERSLGFLTIIWNRNNHYVGTFICTLNEQKQRFYSLKLFTFCNL